MNFPENMTNTLTRLFDDGLDEVLIFAFIFIFVLLSGHDGNENNTVNCGILPLIVIGAFLLLYFGFGRTEAESE